MSLRRLLVVLGKDLRLGPRSPVFLFALFMPVILTIVLQLVFGSLFDPKPRLGVVDLGDSRVTTALEAVDDIDFSTRDDRAALVRDVEANDLDVGVVLPAGFDDALRADGRPAYDVFVGGESLASDRSVLLAAIADVVDDVAAVPSPVTIDVVAVGEQELDISVRLTPLIVMYALVIAAVFLPSFSLADEREKRTLVALGVSPARLSEVVLAKGVLGFVVASFMAVLTLWLNRALSGEPLALVLVLVVAAAMCVEIGLIFGAASRTVTGVFTLIKGSAWLLVGPTVFYIFPDWPQWIARLFPTYWIINPVFEVTIDGAGLADVWADELVALGFIVVLAIPMFWLVGRLRERLASE